nr:hypothetical protein [Escherichia coli]
MFSHPVYLFLREFSLQDFRGGSIELSPEEETGPHDVLACIVESMGPEIIEKASRELLKSARAKGLNAKGKLLPFDPDAIKH